MFDKTIVVLGTTQIRNSTVLWYLKSDQVGLCQFFGLHNLFLITFLKIIALSFGCGR